MILKHFKYILIYANEHIEFRLCEFKALTQIYAQGIKYNIQDFQNRGPYIVVECIDQLSILKIAQKSILIKSVLEHWGQGENKTELVSSLISLPDDFTQSFKHCSYRYSFYTYGRNLTPEMKLERMEALDALPLEGSIQLNHPQQTFFWLEYYDEITKPQPSPTNTQLEIPNILPQKLYFGRWLVDGHRKSLSDFSLSKRKYIGNTSMSPDLAFLMSNLAQVSPGNLIYDPFVGTGSLLVAAAFNAAYVMGSDVEPKMLMARGKSSRCGQGWKNKDETIRMNLEQYGLGDKYMDVLIADSTLPLWRGSEQFSLFDAIITDPPYGIRESSKKISLHPERARDPNGGTSGLIYAGLLEMAAILLVPGGRLVYWLPFVMDQESENFEGNSFDKHDIPSHPDLELTSCVHHLMFGKRIGRYLVTMTKKLIPASPDGSELKVRTKTDNERAFNHLNSFRQKYFSLPIEGAKGNS